MSDSVALSLLARESILRMCHAGGSSHVGSALSCVDIISVIYTHFVRAQSVLQQLPDRDRFIMSKGHAGAAVYAVLAHVGLLDKTLLMSHYQNGSSLSGHVSHKLIDAIEFSTGSLGHGLPIATGLAYGLITRKSKSKVFVLMSDGELDEGSNWEAFLFASHHSLHNLIAIIDRNRLQSLTSTEETLSLEPLPSKLKSFGLNVLQVNGHDHQMLKSSIDHCFDSSTASVIIADTTKGKGVSFMENSVLWHYRPPNDDELSIALSELAK